MTDALLSRPQAVEATCEDCHCRLARDNKDTVCWPCRRRRAIAFHQKSLRNARLHEIFEARGIPGLVDELGATNSEAVRCALDEGMLSRRWRSHFDILVRLANMPKATHVEAAQALGISRWTVADWRRRLGL